jgi:hypothetical protein
MIRLRLADKFGMRRRAEGPRKIVRKIVRNNYCGVTGSRSSRKEKDRSEEEQEKEKIWNKFRTL